MKADGSELKQLTHFDGTGSSAQPTWSPDGEQIIFSSSKQASSLGPVLWVMDANGDNQRVVKDYDPPPPLTGRNADWSPDSTKISFSLCTFCSFATNYAVFVYDLETEQLTRLTGESYESGDPVWSPDGTKIAYASNKYYVDNDSPTNGHDLYIMNADGSNPQRITESGLVSKLAWKPDGTKIAYRKFQNTPGIYQVDIQNGELSLIKEDPTDDIHLQPHAWSEDGNRLLITSRDIDIPGDHTLHIYDTQDSSLTDLITKPFDGNPGIIGADWLWVEKNSNK
ncbi:MAG: hypothetical protein U5J95_08290 [Balneolaceae bacterium]|nr:hypothetical protein [Balneolaceae bacterium]